MIGLMPSHQLLYQYNLVGPYDGLVTCLIQGDIEGYLSNLETHFHYFYQHFTYLLLKERGIVLVWRCLMRNLSIQKKKMGVNMPILSFHDCLIAFRYSSKDESIGLDDVICLLVSLVSQNYIKGYLDLKKSRLVLSKINAFPSVDRVRVYREVYNENSVETYLYESQPDPPADIERLMEE
ncbi:hypothetical protein BDB01DRAFT_714750 [Pilobolus umbonatus]|nr:hypothetical protein BDB01DRAFT_714750 [Pilobolus umbonatus]